MTEEYFRIRRGEHPDIYPMDSSRLETYKRCPALYKFQYIDRLPRVGGDAASLGNVIHDFQEIYLTQGIEAARTYVSAMLPHTKHRDFLKISQTMSQITFKGKPYATERRFHFYKEIAGKTVQFEAKIDILFLYSNKAEVIDGKTGRQLSDSVDNDPQGLFYALACLRTEELAPFDFSSIIFTQAQYQTGKLVSTEFTRSDLESFEKFLYASVQEVIEDNRFKPRPGTHCHWCPYLASHCPVGQSITPEFLSVGGRDIKIRATNLDEATALAEQAMYLDALVRRMKSALKGYMYWNGDQPIETASGKVAIEIVNNKDFEGGMKGVIDRHPEEKDKVVESHYPRVIFKPKENKEIKEKNETS